jgi:hypothetical protein
MEFVRRFGLIMCAGMVIAASVGFLLLLHQAGGDTSRTVLDMDFAVSADGDSSAELIWTVIAVAAGVFALLSLLTALVPNFGRDEQPAVAEPTDTATLDSDAIRARMKETAESVDGVDHAEAAVVASNGHMESSKIDLFVKEGQDSGRISDEVADRVRTMLRDEYKTEPDEGIEVDIHQARRFFGAGSGQTA